MPWYQTDPMTERTRFIITFEDGPYSMTELCQRFSISRKTGYKWLGRYREHGVTGLADLSRAPHRSPHQTPADIEQRIVGLRGKHPRWGPRKLLHYLAREYPEIDWPAESTAADMLKRHNLVQPGRRRTRPIHPGAAPMQTSAPNQIWTADFKGQVRINGQYCYPLTVVDADSRFFLSCHSLPSTRRDGVKPVFENLFKSYGLPEAIRTDNGTPFASPGRLGLTLLSVWWLKLGMSHQRISPGKPQQNARHERLHRTLKEATMLPPAATLSAQQKRFDAFVEEYNHVRPHQSLDGDVPASRYQPSKRSMPHRIKEPDYPGHFEVRKVSSSGTIRFKNKTVFLSHALIGEYLGLEEVDFGVWDINFYNTLLARYDETNHRFT